MEKSDPYPPPLTKKIRYCQDHGPKTLTAFISEAIM
jgi:hypothetical protein